VNGECTNNVGSFICECNMACSSGFSFKRKFVYIIQLFTTQILPCIISCLWSHIMWKENWYSALLLFISSFDVNECLSSPCDVNGECTNNVGSFICECNIGYSGNGFTCEGKIDVL
jgi:hypothetical protein